MASSSVSQESLDMDDFDNTARRNRIRVHRGHSGRGSLPYRTLPDKGDAGDNDKDGRGEHTENGDHSHSSSNTLGISSHSHLPGVDHESPTRSAAARLKDKRSRAIHMKGKLPKDKRKLREKRRSTGVVHCMPSTESTGDSLDDEDDDEDNGGETKKNTCYNESTTSGHHHQTLYEARHSSTSPYSPKRGNKSPSDLEADLEDNQDYDSTVSHSETNLTLIGRSESYEASQALPGRQGAIPGVNKKIGAAGVNASSSKYSPESRSIYKSGAVASSPNMGSSGADSPSRPNFSSTSSSSPFLSRHRESDSPRSLSGSNSSNIFSYSNTRSNSNPNYTGASANRNPDPDSPRLLSSNRNTSSITTGSDPHYASHSPPGGTSSVKDNASGETRGEKPSYLSGHLPISQRFRDNDRYGGGGVGGAGSGVGGGGGGISSGYSRVTSYQSPRPFASSSASLPSAAVQQQNENAAQLEKMLEKEREDNKKLQQQLEDKDKKIAELEKAIELLNNECDGLDEDNLKLQEENKALIRAMSRLTANV